MVNHDSMTQTPLHLLCEKPLPEVSLFGRAEGSHAVGEGPPKHEAGVRRQGSLHNFIYTVRDPHLRESQPMFQLVRSMLRSGRGGGGEMRDEE